MCVAGNWINSMQIPTSKFKLSWYGIILNIDKHILLHSFFSFSLFGMYAPQGTSYPTGSKKDHQIKSSQTMLF